MKQQMTSKAVVRYQPEYICPWVVVVTFSDGFEHPVNYANTKEDARLSAKKWNERETK